MVFTEKYWGKLEIGKTIPEFNDPVDELSESNRLSLIHSLVFVLVDSIKEDVL